MRTWTSPRAGVASIIEFTTERSLLGRCPTIIPLHQREDNSFVQSSTVDETGKVVKYYTHKGFSATSTWGRAQAWGILFSTMSHLAAPVEASWLEAAERGAEWWIAHTPQDYVAFWDFNDPAIPNTERDTAAAAVASSALLKLSKASKEACVYRKPHPSVMP